MLSATSVGFNGFQECFLQVFEIAPCKIVFFLNFGLFFQKLSNPVLPRRFLPLSEAAPFNCNDETAAMKEASKKKGGA